MNGKGVLYNDNGNKKYEGEWKDDLPHGKGIWYDNDNCILYEGYFCDGTPSDNRKWYDDDVDDDDRKELEDMACLMYEYCLWNYYNQLQKKNKRRKRRI